jgi:hypothetical protein
LTTGYQIGVQWTEGLYDGGSPVLDYQVEVTDELGSVSNYVVAELKFLVTGLAPGNIYTFVVKTRNLVGQSLESNAVQILAA